MQEQSLSPLDRAREALRADELDNSLMVSGTACTHVPGTLQTVDHCSMQSNTAFTLFVCCLLRYKRLLDAAHISQHCERSLLCTCAFLHPAVLTFGILLACVLQEELLAELEGELFDLRDQLAASAGETDTAHSRQASRHYAVAVGTLAAWLGQALA